MIRGPLMESACPGWISSYPGLHPLLLAGRFSSCSPTRPSALLHCISPLNMSPAVLPASAPLEDSPAEAQRAGEANPRSGKAHVGALNIWPTRGHRGGPSCSDMTGAVRDLTSGSRRAMGYSVGFFITLGAVPNGENTPTQMGRITLVCDRCAECIAVGALVPSRPTGRIIASAPACGGAGPRDAPEMRSWVSQR
ncbi:unnamed protein product [Arctogadus glacialis]